MNAGADKQPLVFGAIADDLTGGLELASMLVARGIPTSLSVGSENIKTVKTAHVIALKSRVAPVADAVGSVEDALQALTARNARQIFFKYCATFDSTPAGNIGPCAEAIMEKMGVEQALFVPALCETKRTVYQGHMFGGAQLLAESPKRYDPLTPMTDSNLVRVLQAQSRRTAGLIDYKTVDEGADAIRAKCDALAASGEASLLLVDTLYEHHLATIATVTVDMPFLTGNSSVAAYLPPIWLERGLVANPSPARLEGVDGPGAVLVGSVAAQSAAQLEHFGATNAVFSLDLARAYAGHDLVAEAKAFAEKAIAAGRNFAISTALPQARIDELQAAHGRLEIGAKAESILSDIAKVIVSDLGVRRLVVAGGETSGSVVRALGITELEVGPYREPGYSRALAAKPFPIALMLKSGKLGGIDILSTALEDMRHSVEESALTNRWPPKG